MSAGARILFCEAREADPITRATIQPFRDHYPEEYSRGLEAAVSRGLTGLRTFLRRWAYVAPDAHDVAHRLDDRAFRHFRHELRRERSGDPSAKPLDDSFLEMRMPSTMFIVSLAALRLRIPWGSAFHRLLARRAIVERGGAVRSVKGSLRLILERPEALRAPSGGA